MTITKQSIVDKYNSFFSTTKTYDKLSKEEIQLIAQILSAENTSSGGSITSSIKIIDSENDELKITSTGKLDINSITTLPLATNASTETTLASVLNKLPNVGTAGTPSTNVISVQGVPSGKSLNVYDTPFSFNLSDITFSASDISSTFTMSEKFLLAVFPPITGAPTIKVQVSLDGTNWADSSISLVTSASTYTLLESDSFARLAGVIAKGNALRFNSSSSITTTIKISTGHG